MLLRAWKKSWLGQVVAIAVVCGSAGFGLCYWLLVVPSNAEIERLRDRIAEGEAEQREVVVLPPTSVGWKSTIPILSGQLLIRFSGLSLDHGRQPAPSFKVIDPKGAEILRGLGYTGKRYVFEFQSEAYLLDFLGWSIEDQQVRIAVSRRIDADRQP